MIIVRNIEDKNCKKFNEGFAFEESNRLICKNKNEFNENYYTKDEGISYYKYDGNGEGRISNYNNCEYSNNELICNECKSDYILKDDETNICNLKHEFINDKKYFYRDEFHIKSCNKEINNCEECKKEDYAFNCLKCENNYFFVNENYFQCIQKELITPLDEYYYDEVKTVYYSYEILLLILKNVLMIILLIYVRMVIHL